MSIKLKVVWLQSPANFSGYIKVFGCCFLCRILFTCWQGFLQPAPQPGPGGSCRICRELAGTGQDLFSVKTNGELDEHDIPPQQIETEHLTKKLLRLQTSVLTLEVSVNPPRTSGRRYPLCNKAMLIFALIILESLQSSRSTLGGARHGVCSRPSCHGACARVCGPPATWRRRWGWGRGGARLLHGNKTGRDKTEEKNKNTIWAQNFWSFKVKNPGFILMLNLLLLPKANFIFLLWQQLKIKTVHVISF